MRQEEKALMTKNKIIAAATKLFSEKGYDETTMQDIMLLSGLSKGAIYHYFKSKQAILDDQINRQKELVTNYLKDLKENPTLTAKQKIENIIDHLCLNEALLELTGDRWAEKIPFALLDTLRNSLNVLAVYIAEMLRQGNTNQEFNCAYPKEVSEILVLLIDIWLDPIIVDSSYEDMCSKIDFIILLLEKFDTPIISVENEKKMKERLRAYYV
ncbi:TetR/AcrR family transcriptional regulator [Amphibacillus sp. Q70]|uniref:TetR/AcrR family transcriptional regulator n=1 Tax=Amphibacillus sp. Q70 TaxID=3453416 RepID=UPI003F86210A